MEGGKVGGGGRRRNNCEEGRRRKEGEDARGGELEEWLELYLSPGSSRLRECDSETRVVMLAEAMANIDHAWFGGLR